MSAAPVEGKVSAQAQGTGAGLALYGFLLWVLGVTVWGVPADAAHAVAAAAAVPAPVIGLLALLPVGLGYACGYTAKHTPRPVDAATELVAGPDLSVVATALAELRAIIANAAAAGLLTRSEPDRSWTDSPRSGGSTSSATSSPSGSNAGSSAAGTSSTPPVDASAAGSDGRADSVEGRSMVESARPGPVQ